MALDPGYAADLFGAVGEVRRRTMFGGTGVYAGDAMFALEAGGVLYLKSGPSTDALFAVEDAEPFSYVTAGGRRTITSYRRVPDRLFDEPDALAAFARRALEIARAAKDAKPRRRRQAR